MALKDYATLQADVDATWGDKDHLKQPALDALESQMRVVGGLDLVGGPVVEVLDSDFVVLDSYDTVPFQSNITMNAVTGIVTVNAGGGGFYQVNFVASILSNANFTMELAAAKTGTIDPTGILFPLKNNEVVNVTAGFVVELADADAFGILIRAVSGSPTITVDSCNLDLFRIG